MDNGQSLLTMQEVQLKIKMIKKKQYRLFPRMGSSGGVETYSNRMFLFFKSLYLNSIHLNSRDF